MKLSESTWEEIGIGTINSREPRFITHLNYIKCLNNFSDSLNAKIKRFDKSDKKRSDKLAKKINLIKLIKKGLDEEYKMSKSDKESAEVFSIWIHVKSYYLIFNLFLVLDYLISPENNKEFNLTHKETMKKIKVLIKDSHLVFNKTEFNHLYKYVEVKYIKFLKGENLKEEQDWNKVSKCLIRKLFNYKIEELKRENNFKNFKTKKAREKLREYLVSELTGFYEFFYWFRIKANYRDLEFLSNDVGSMQFYSYFENYYILTINFYEALKSLINELSKKRFNEEIIK